MYTRPPKLGMKLTLTIGKRTYAVRVVKVDATDKRKATVEFDSSIMKLPPFQFRIACWRGSAFSVQEPCNGDHVAFGNYRVRG